MSYTYTIRYGPEGWPNVLRSDGAFMPSGCPDWQMFLAWNAAQAPPLDYTTPHPPAIRKPRTLLAVYTDLQALTATQKTNVWTNLSSGSPKKYLADTGANAAAIGTLDWAVTDSGATGTSLTAAKMRVAACYVQDNPNYLVNPAFDSSILIPGDQPG